MAKFDIKNFLKENKSYCPRAFRDIYADNKGRYRLCCEAEASKPLDKFKPEVILISAGFDAHIRDPLANINLESNDYFEITKKIVDLANIHSNGRIISFFEGGYDLQALSESVKEHLIALK